MLSENVNRAARRLNGRREPIRADVTRNHRSFTEMLRLDWFCDCRSTALTHDEGVKLSRQAVRQARQRAKRIMAMLQGTMGLEGQALDKKTVRAMTRQTAEELLAS